MTASEAEKLCELYAIPLEELFNSYIPDYEKYKQMVLAFLKTSLTVGDGRIPKTKLAKLLYLADFAWYYENLESMSGMQYRKIQYGPVADSYFRVIDELYENGQI